MRAAAQQQLNTSLVAAGGRAHGIMLQAAHECDRGAAVQRIAWGECQRKAFSSLALGTRFRGREFGCSPIVASSRNTLAIGADGEVITWVRCAVLGHAVWAAAA